MNRGTEKTKVYTRDVESNYCTSIGLSPDYTFANGIIIRAIPAIETTINGIFIMGAYPSAIFNYGKIPVDNLKKPFDDTSNNKSAKELEETILKPLNISRNQCWITNLVKVFLSKEGHNCSSNGEMLNTRVYYEKYAKKSLPWIFREIEIAQPKLIITLGGEVAGILTGEMNVRKRNTLLDYKIRKITINNESHNIVHMAHPGILMRKNVKKNKWPKKHKLGLENLRYDIQKILSKTKRRIQL